MDAEVVLLVVSVAQIGDRSLSRKLDGKSRLFRGFQATERLKFTLPGFSNLSETQRNQVVLTTY